MRLRRLAGVRLDPGQADLRSFLRKFIAGFLRRPAGARLDPGQADLRSFLRKFIAGFLRRREAERHQTRPQ